MRFLPCVWKWHWGHICCISSMYSIFGNFQKILCIIWITPKNVTAIRTTWNYQFSWVQSFSCVRLFATLWTVARQASLSFPISQSLLKLMSIESVMPSNHLLCRPLLLLPLIFPSIRVFSSESVLCLRWLKYWNFSISLSNEYSGLISFRMDWFDLFAVQGFWRVFSNTTVQKHQFFSTQLSVREGDGTPLQYSRLENPMDKGAW